MNTQPITLDVSKQTGMMPVIRIGQGDKNGTTIEATIYDNGSPLSLSGYSVRFEMRLPDGTSYYQSPNGTVSGNVATIPIDETYAGAVDGVTNIAYIVVYSGSVECSTSRINVIVLESAEEGADAAHAYSSGIIEATNAANSAAASATGAAGSATTAAANADAKAGLADSAATAANSAASTASTAAANANTAAAAADTARESIQDELAAKADADGYYQLLTAGLGDALLSGDSTVGTFARRVSDHDGACKIESLRGNTVVESGELLSVNVEGVKAVGFNQWDEEWELGSYNIETGAPYTANNRIRSKNPISVLPLTEYSITAPYSGVFDVIYYDANNTYIGYKTNRNSRVFTTPSNCAYINLSMWGDYGAIYKHDICINLSNPALNGTYRPYTEQTREIPASTYFPNGMRSAGTAYDELQKDKAVTRIGVVDLGTLNWGYHSSSGQFRAQFTDAIRPTTQNVLSNVLCVPYRTVTFSNNGIGAIDKSIARYYSSIDGLNVRDDSFNGDAAAFKSAMNGVLLYYESVTHTTMPIDPPLNMSYPVETGGVESIVVPTGEMSAPPTFVYVQGYDADGVVDKALSVIAAIEGAKASANYSVGSYLVHDGTLYRVTTAIATGEAINPGSNVTATTVMAEIIRLIA